MASPASKKMAKIWQCRRSLCQPDVSCLAITVHTGCEPFKKQQFTCVQERHCKFQACASWRSRGATPIHLWRTWSTRRRLEPCEKIIHDPVRTLVHNARLRAKVNAGTLTSSGLLKLDDVYSLNCCMYVWVNMVQLLISSVVQLLTMSKPTLDN